MSINVEDLAARAREHLTEQDEAVKFTTERLIALVPSALAEWIRRTEGDAAKRRNFIAQTGTINVADGVAEVLTALEAKGIQSQFVTADGIYFDFEDSLKLPIQLLSSHPRLTLGGIQDKFFLNIYFDGKRMFFRNPDDVDSPLDSLTGSMMIRAVSVPRDLVDIPQSVEGEIASILAEIAKKFNTDGTHKGEQINYSKAR